MRYALGFDPDLHTTAAALVSVDELGQTRIEHLHVFSVAAELRGQVASAAMCVELAKWVPHWLHDRGACLDIVVAEGQQIFKSTLNWDSITALGPVSGACITASWDKVRGDLFLVPFPADWTGGIPKHVRQARMWKQRGVPYVVRGPKTGRYAAPTEQLDLRGYGAGDWKHLGDAVGLALWGLAQLDGDSLLVAGQ